ncbi:MAG: hypothetical protein ABJQ55_07485, partial [Hyphomicrobiales bacterium]
SSRRPPNLQVRSLSRTGWVAKSHGLRTERGRGTYADQRLVAIRLTAPASLMICFPLPIAWMSSAWRTGLRLSPRFVPALSIAPPPTFCPRVTSVRLPDQRSTSRRRYRRRSHAC